MLLETAQQLGMASPEYVYFCFTRMPEDSTYKPWIPENVLRTGNFKEEDYEDKKKLFFPLKQVY